MSNELSEERLREIASALSGLTPSQWNDVMLTIEHLYRPVKKTLTSEEISAMLIQNKKWF